MTYGEAIARLELAKALRLLKKIPRKPRNEIVKRLSDCVYSELEKFPEHLTDDDLVLLDVNID